MTIERIRKITDMKFFTDDMKCQCCGKEHTKCAVIASPAGPISWAYCVDCLEYGAQVKGDLDYLVEHAGLTKEKLGNVVIFSKEANAYVHYKEAV